MHGPSFGSLALSRFISQFPGLVHHGCEICIILDGGRDIVVVLFELLFGDDVVWGLIISHRMGNLKSFKEFAQNLILGFFPLKNIWMLCCIVNTSNIVDIDPATAIFIQLFEGLENNLPSGRVHWASNSSNEFIKFNQSTSVEIKVGEEFLDFSFGEAEHVISHSFGEFIFVERL